MPSHEAEFNRWYDREHLEERVAIPGFLEARRYVAHEGTPKYLSLYSTETFEVLDSPAYRTALANQTDMVEGQHRALQEHDPERRAHHHQPRSGPGRRARHRPHPRRSGQRGQVARGLAGTARSADVDGIISMHLLESDPVLSKPITDDPSAPNPGARDWLS